MSIKETIESICKDLKVTCVYAELDEANTFVDRLKKREDFPVLVVLPYQVVDEFDQRMGYVGSSFPLNAFMLTKLKQTTIDMSANDIEGLAIEPMRAKAREFMKQLNNSAIVAVRKISKVVYTPTFSSMDSHLHGVSIYSEVPVIEAVKTC